MNTRQNILLALGVVAFGAGAWAQAAGKGGSALSAASQIAQTAAEQSPAIGAHPAKGSRHRQQKANKAFLAGVRAIEKGDARAAEEDFELAHVLDPENRRYPLSAEVARQYVVAQFVQRAQNEWSTGHRDEAMAELEAALRFDPESPAVAGFVATLAADVSFRQPALRTESREPSEPIALKPQEGQHNFHLRTDKRSQVSQVLNAFGIRATIDQSVNAQRIPFDADNVDFAEASELLELATDTFLVPLDARSVIAVADTKENRAKFQHNVMRTFYFPGLSSKELTDMGNIARNIFGTEQSALEPNTGTLTVRATESELEALDQTFGDLLAGRSEVQLDVRLYEIDKTKATNVGVILPNSATMFNVPSELKSILQNNASLVNQLLQEYPSLAGNEEAILAALIASGALTGTVFNNPFAVFGGGLTLTGIEWNATSINMLLNSSDARSFNQQVLRVLDQEEATIRSGERYPIMASSYSGLSGSSSSSATFPQIQYEDLGLTLKVKPRIENENAISLNLDLKVSSLAGSTVNSIPVLNSREYTGVTSIRPGDTVMVASAVSKQDVLEITGVPGLSDIPGMGGTNRQNTQDVMELVILVTPHIVRLAHTELAGQMLLLPRH